MVSVGLLVSYMLLITLSGCGVSPSANDKRPAPAAPAGKSEGVKPSAQKTTYPVTVKDSEGRAVVIPAEPKRIVSVAPANTELLFALGKGSAVIARSSYCDYPADALKIENIVDYFSLDHEKLVAMKPDLMLVVGGTAEVRDKLIAEYKINLFVVQPTTFEELYESITALGVALDAQETAAEIIRDMGQTVKEVVAKTAGLTTKPKVFMETYYDPTQGGVWTTGTGTFQDMLIQMAGGINAAAEAKGYVEFNLERLLVANPDVIITDSAAAASVKDRKGWAGIKAVKESRVIGLTDVNLVSRPGPRLVDGLKLLAESLHPDRFKQ